MLNELLTNSSWIQPQIDFLVYLQNFRNYTNGTLDQLFLSITVFAEFFLSTLMIAIVYWCIDTKSGLYLISLNSISLIISQLIKMIGCVYRPWVLSDKIKPVESAVAHAGGYSFPSGHSSVASSSIGGIAYLLKKHIFCCVFLILYVLLIGFSRLYLGVHTPQDVVGGLSLGFVLIFVMKHLVDWCEEDKNRYLISLFEINIVSACMLYYICAKNYPLGIVNPQKSIYIAVIYYAWFFGVINGAYLCRRFFPFEASKGSVKTKITRGVVGALILYILLHQVMQVEIFDKDWNVIIASVTVFGMGLFVSFGYPILFVNVENFLSNK